MVRREGRPGIAAVTAGGFDCQKKTGRIEKSGDNKDKPVGGDFQKVRITGGHL
jgi:hypothetical protein